MIAADVPDREVLAVATTVAAKTRDVSVAVLFASRLSYGLLTPLSKPLDGGRNLRRSSADDTQVTLHRLTGWVPRRGQRAGPLVPSSSRSVRRRGE